MTTCDGDTRAARAGAGAAPAADPTPTSIDFPHLFSPIDLAGYRLRNRIVHAGTSNKYSAGGRVTQKFIDYYASRARGGAAMLVSEPLNMLARQRNPLRPTVYGGIDSAGLARWAAAVGEHGSWLIGQVQDSGRGRHEAGRSNDAIGASALPDDISWTVPHVLTTDAVADIVGEWARSSRLLKNAGFAGVELSAGHGHLFHQFLARWSNQRTDRYGGDLDGRTRLIVELIQAIRAECGQDFIVGVKLPGADGTARGIDEAEARKITELIQRCAPPDYLTYCWGSHADDLHWHLPDLHGPRMPYVDAIHALSRSAPGIPVGALGLITDPHEAEQILRDGLADLVMLGRSLISDAAWGEKARTGQTARIRSCVSCNTCWQMTTAGLPLQCDNNPRLGTPDEADWRPIPSRDRKRIVIVGAGIAGMEAAWVAAGRGHDVIMFGASGEPGGKTRLHAALPGGAGLSSIYDYQMLAAAQYGVRCEFDVRAGLDDVLALSPDVVVLAAGSTPRWPEFLPEDDRGAGMFPDLREAVGSLLRVGRRQRGRAVIYDQDHGAFVYSAAEFLHERFAGVTLITERERIAADEPLVGRQGIYRRLYTKGIEVVTLARPQPHSNFEAGELAYANIYSGRETIVTDVALLTFATSRIPDDALAAPLRALGIDTRLIGDCFAPRSVLTATAEGHRCGEAV